eukprot:8349530-Karenia_brevis.AAC.1
MPPPPPVRRHAHALSARGTLSPVAQCTLHHRQPASAMPSDQEAAVPPQNLPADTIPAAELKAALAE